MVYHMQVTTDLLVSTQAGKKLRKLTKHSNAAVAQAAAAAVAAWKTAVTQEAGIVHNGSAAGGTAIPVYCAEQDSLLSKHFCTSGHDLQVCTEEQHGSCMVLPCACFLLSPAGALS